MISLFTRLCAYQQKLPVLMAFAWALPCAAATPATLSPGIWQGSIGTHQIVLCSEGPNKAAYHYLGHAGDIALTSEAAGWSESANGTVTGYWRSSTILDGAFTGQWSAPNRKKVLPIELMQVSGQSAACVNEDYKNYPNVASANDVLKLPIGTGQIAANRGAAVLKPDGSLWVWGKKTRNVPKLMGKEFVKVAVGDNHALAIRTDGSLWGWGENNAGQLGGDGVDGSQLVKMGSGFVQIAAGQDYSYGIKHDGSLWAWGGMPDPGKFGELSGRNDKPVLVGTGYVAVSAREYHAGALKGDGSLWMWGRNHDGQLGNGHSGYGDSAEAKPVLVGRDFAQVSVGYSHTAAIKKDGSLWAWGHNNWGDLGDGTELTRDRPVRIGDGFAYVVAGFLNTAAVKADGSLWLWGGNEKGLFGDCTTSRHITPVRIGAGFVQAALGQDFLLASKNDGSQWTWGWRWDGDQLDTPSLCRKAAAVPFDPRGNKWDQPAVPAKAGWARAQPAGGTSGIAAFGSTSAIAKADGSLWTWGENTHGQLGDGTHINRHEPTHIGDGYVHVDVSEGHVSGLKKDGQLLRWGVDSLAMIFAPKSGKVLEPLKLSEGIVQVLPGGDHQGRALGLKADGTLWDWQYAYAVNTAPVKIGTDVRAISTSDFGGFAIRVDGSLWKLRSYPVEAPAQVGRDFVRIASGKDRAYGIKTDGSLWAWGDSSFGHLGNGGRQTQLDPVKIGDNFVDLAVGRMHGLALSADGTLWAWGRNEVGAVGDGTTIDRGVPVKIGAGFRAIAAGDFHSMAEKADGTLWAWGNNEDGQLGDGTLIRRLKPVQIVVPPTKPVPPASSPLAEAPSVPGRARGIGVATSFACALLDDGHVKCWGSNAKGELGNEKRLDINPVPVRVSGVEKAVDLLVGDEQSCATITNGHVVCWGNSTWPGKPLGDGNAVDIGEIVGGARALFSTSPAASSCFVSRSGKISGRCAIACASDDQAGRTAAKKSDAISAEAREQAKLCVKIIASLPYLHDASFLTKGEQSERMCGLMKNGNVQCFNPRSGDGVKIAGIHEATAVMMSGDNGCALQRNGLVKCWGRNSHGELGNGQQDAGYMLQETAEPVLEPGI